MPMSKKSCMELPSASLISIESSFCPAGPRSSFCMTKAPGLVAFAEAGFYPFVLDRDPAF